MNTTETTYTVNHITGYEPTTEDGPGAAIIETFTVTEDELHEIVEGPEDAVETLIRTGTLGQHNEWKILATN